MHFVVWDLEIANAILGRGETPTPGVRYCKGWGDHAGMGISVLAAYDSKQDRIRVFCEDNRDEFAALLEAADLSVTYNGVRFDNAVVQAVWDITPDPAKDYDLLREIKEAAGFAPDAPARGFKLEDMALANFSQPKTGDGAKAPADWQAGRVGTVIDYCVADVWLTTRLFMLARDGGVVVNPNGGELVLRNPEPDAAW